jgi:hypothetical protein
MKQSSIKLKTNTYEPNHTSYLNPSNKIFVRIKYLLSLLLIILPFSGIIQAQELDARIQISASRIQGTSNQQLFQNMQQSLYEFINNTNWTNHVYDRDERIECNFVITLTEQVSTDEFKGSLQIQASRPVFGTSYMSQLINHVDNDFHFRYVEFEQLEFNPNTHGSNLTSVIAFWVYVILGYDYDSFGNRAGTEYFQIAEKIIQNAQNAPERGWKAYENLKNRYWLIENLLNDQYSPMRDFMYVYHRQGLDKMADKPADSRLQIEEALEHLKTVHRRKPGSLLMTIVTTAKGDEIIEIFKEGFPDERTRVYNIMKEIDPANTSKYDKMMKGPEQP